MAAHHATVRRATDTVQGQGSSFDSRSLVSAAFPHYSAVNVNYQATGSGAGQATLTRALRTSARLTCPWAFLDSFSDLSKITQFPVTRCAGSPLSTTCPFNRTQGQLKITGSVIAKIYMGKIKLWSDPQLTKKNPGLKKLKGNAEDSITVVHRSDSSGTTYAFTDFLSRTSAWKTRGRPTA